MLAADGWADGDRIVSRGLSAGGLLQGAVFSMAPRRWRAVVAEVPFVDCVTTMLDPAIPLTINEWDEWGDPRDPGARAYLASYSPYDNIPACLGLICWSREASMIRGCDPMSRRTGGQAQGHRHRRRAGAVPR